MSSTINQNSISINSTPDKVWEVLTTNEGITQCLPSIKVFSEWKLGSNVEYTCYSPDGSIMQWGGKEIIWKGKIVEFEINKIYSVDYNGSGELTKETYELKTENETVKLTFTQECVNEKIAQGYEAGNAFTLQAIKKYLEK
ncbi:MAG: SRPBCC domain-containing protein [Candidatus Parcubacteria bacterium]|nr:SRPBCC domain-containing protein [Candidatus Paceibacterota bacterium]